MGSVWVFSAYSSLMWCGVVVGFWFCVMMGIYVRDGLRWVVGFRVRVLGRFWGLAGFYVFLWVGAIQLYLRSGVALPRLSILGFGGCEWCCGVVSGLRGWCCGGFWCFVFGVVSCYGNCGLVVWGFRVILV